MVYVADKEIKGSTYLRRNFDGTVFIDKGGYVNKRRWGIINKSATVLNIVLMLFIGFFQIRGCGSSSNTCSEKCNTIKPVLLKKEHILKDTSGINQKPPLDTFQNQ